MPNGVRVIQYGLGPIGSAIARHVVGHAMLDLVGAVDIDPTKVGTDVGEVIGLGSPIGFPVVGWLTDILPQTEADVVIHSTASHFEIFKGQIIALLEAGLDIVSTAEELSFPWLAHPQEAAEIDSVARRTGRTVMGTGVNPGFVMDALPLFMTAICQQVTHIRVVRIIDASTRRRPFQIKIGSGLTVEAFEARIAAGRLGHVGLPESMGMVFHTLGKELAHYESSIEPMVADQMIKTDSIEVRPGQVVGLRQTARGYTEEGEFMRLVFVAALGAGEDGDTIKISGKPNLEVNLKGTNGDIATVAIAVNAVRRVREAAPGLFTMRDLPIVTSW